MTATSIAERERGKAKSKQDKITRRQKGFAMLWAVMSWMFVGLVIGALARLVAPGRQSMGLLGTSGLGIGGAMIGGLISWVFTGVPQQQEALVPWPGWILSIIGAVILLALLQRHRRV